MFYERSAQILADVQDARYSTASLNERAQGSLRINVPTAFGRRHVMPHIKDFLAAYPDSRLDATLTDATIDLIETGMDVAVGIGVIVWRGRSAAALGPMGVRLPSCPTRASSFCHHSSIDLP